MSDLDKCIEAFLKWRFTEKQTASPLDEHFDGVVDSEIRLNLKSGINKETNELLVCLLIALQLGSEKLPALQKLSRATGESIPTLRSYWKAFQAKYFRELDDNIMRKLDNYKWKSKQEHPFVGWNSHKPKGWLLEYVPDEPLIVLFFLAMASGTPPRKGTASYLVAHAFGKNFRTVEKLAEQRVRKLYLECCPAPHLISPDAAENQFNFDEAPTEVPNSIFFEPQKEELQEGEMQEEELQPTFKTQGTQTETYSYRTEKGRGGLMFLKPIQQADFSPTAV